MACATRTLSTCDSGHLTGGTTPVAPAELRAFCEVALRHVDHSIRANRRPDGLYHSYNLMRLDGAAISVRHLDEMLVRQARVNGVSCRLLIETGTIDASHRTRLGDYASEGVEIRQAPTLPMKLALFDGRSNGLIQLQAGWTAPVGLEV